MQAALSLRYASLWWQAAGICLTIGIPFLGAGLYAAYDQLTLDRRFETQGLTARGMVLTKAVHQSKKTGDTAYTMTFRFTRADGESVQSGATVSKALWNTLEERGPLEVRYLPEWPNHFLAPGEAVKDNLVLAIVFLAVGTLLSAGGGFAVAWVVRRKREIARLRREGQLAKAAVSDARETGMRIGGEWQVEVRFSYRDAGGREHRGGVTLAPAEARPWAAGRTAYVRYDQARPEVHVWLGEITQ